VNAGARLIEIAAALTEAGVAHLIMGGHAVRHYGVERSTVDFDFHVSADRAGDLERRLRSTSRFAQAELGEGPSWRPGDFRRYRIGVLPGGRDEWIEFWFRNHLLPPFAELHARREESVEGGATLCFLPLPDLIRSKETEREDDWADVRLLEEVLDERNLAGARDPAGRLRALAQLRSRRGFERAAAAGFPDPAIAEAAIGQARHAVTCAYLLPLAPTALVPSTLSPWDPAVDRILRRLEPGSARHLAVVEVVRLAYQRAARAADLADKQQRGPRTS
jgi:hypothetical protein